jgi:hypothetical protein
MGADGVLEALKTRRECLCLRATKLLILLEFSSLLGFANYAKKG